MADAIVLDSSAILAGLYGEHGGEAVMKALADDDLEVLISTINLCEVVTKLALAGASGLQIAGIADSLLEHCVDFDPGQAIEAGAMTIKTGSLGLSLGDRACLTLARSCGATAWTTDTAWKKLNAGVKVRLLRGSAT